jgi:ATP-binding cassette subfamily C protein CydD
VTDKQEVRRMTTATKRWLTGRQALMRPKSGSSVRRASTDAEALGGASRQLAALSRHARRNLAFAVAAPLLAGFLLPPQLWLFAGVIDSAVVNGASVVALTAPLLGIVALMATRAALVWAGEARGSRAVADITLTSRKALMAHVFRQRPDWSAARSSGELSGAIVDQIGALDGYFARYVPAMALAAALPILFVVTALFVEPVVGILFLVSAPLIPVFMALVGWGAEAAHSRHQQAFLRLTGFFADRLRGLVTLKLLGRAESETLRLRQSSDDLRSRSLEVLRIAFLSSAVLEFFAALGVAGVALYVGLSYLGFLHLGSSPLTLQTGLFCLMLAPEVYFPLRQFATHYHDRAAAKATMTSLTALFETMPPLDPPSTPASLERIADCPEPISVAARALTIRTPDGAYAVLVDADFTVAPNARVAIVGASGVGKSTLLEALAGLRDYEGAINLGGAALGDIPSLELRRRVAVLGQRPRLFHGSIVDNIRFGRKDASVQDIRDAAERAGVMRFARDLPEGLQTPMGECGFALSGGEAHRVALARVFLRDPDLILLDEPTAHLDLTTEQAVLEGILDFAQGRTLIIATHSRVVVDRMDETLRIEGQRIFLMSRRTPDVVFQPKRNRESSRS